MVSLPNHDNEGSNPNSVALTMGLPRPTAGLAKTEEGAVLIAPTKYLHHLPQTFARLQFDGVVGSFERW